MTTDYAEKERQFIRSLESETGCDLDGWMRRIAAQNLPHRNDIIDWLRVEGFAFAKASWLERIYANGGNPVYPEPTAPARETAATPAKSKSETDSGNGDKVDGDEAEALPAATVCGGRAQTPSLHKPSLRLVVSNQDQAPARTGGDSGSGSDSNGGQDLSGSLRDKPPGHGQRPGEEKIEAALVQAKGLRPLAQLILARIHDSAPNVVFAAEGPLIIASLNGQPMALLTVQPKELRLGLNRTGLGDHERLSPARFTIGKGRIPAAISHMCILNDARQIDSELMKILSDTASAATRV